ncbi:PAS domain-containing sensor histidine kinase [Pseudaquabacterium rugosum]|uniref:histidine kinase n=1 Tax=Pseudaquabacterium rugosum TaxID=2984194 RepID=A0ABU9BFB2_9BURK
MKVQTAPAVLWLQLAPDGHYRLLQRDAGRSLLGRLPAHGRLDEALREAGLPALCVERLLDLMRAGSSNAWPIRLPDATGRAVELLLSTSPPVRPPGPPEAPADAAPDAAPDDGSVQALVTLTPLAAIEHRGELADTDTEIATGADADADRRPVRLRLDAQARLLQIDGPWAAVVGLAPEACIGRPLADALAPQAVGTWQGLLARARAGTLDALDRRQPMPLRPQPGSLRWIEFSALHWHAGDGPSAGGWEACFSEITTNVRQQQLQHIRERALDLTGAGVVVIDAMSPRHPMVLVNRSFCRLTGYDESAILGRSLRFFTGIPNGQEGAATLDQALREGRAAGAVVASHRRDGTPYWAQFTLTPFHDPDNGLLTHVVAVLADVTESRELIARLSQQSAMLHAVHHDNPNGLIAFDEQGGVCLQNAAVKTLTGLYLVGLTRRKCFEALAALADEGAPDLETGLERHGWLQWPVRQPRERVIELRRIQQDSRSAAMLLVLRDVTAETQLHQMQREFLATAAHEMRTPMTSIRGFAGLLLTEAVAPDVQRELIGRIHHQSLRLSQLLNDLLDVSRIEAQGQGGPLVLQDLALESEVQDVLRTLATPEAADRLQLRPAPRPLVVRSHRAKLTQILLNLVSNALKYSRDRVTVTLTFDPAEGCAHIAVRDQGVGLSQAMMSRLFTKFYRVDPDGATQGTGLGLYIARTLAEQLGGRIEVCSELGVGSTFTLTLPLAGPG